MPTLSRNKIGKLSTVKRTNLYNLNLKFASMLDQFMPARNYFLQCLTVYNCKHSIVD